MVQYLRPRRLLEALEMLKEAGPAARPLVGGTDILVDVRRRPWDTTVLVDLKHLADLPPAIELGNDVVRFGPTATMAELSSIDEIDRWYPALVAASRVVGSIAIRNRATLIGNICHASPAADTAPPLLVHDASVVIAGVDGERTIALTDFFTGPGATVCAPGELVVRLELPVPAQDYRSAFERLTRRRGVDLATVSVAAGVSVDGTVTLGLGAVAPTPLRVQTVTPIDLDDPSAIDAAVEDLLSASSPISDVRATRDYRAAMTAVLARRAILRASARSDDAEERAS